MFIPIDCCCICCCDCCCVATAGDFFFTRETMNTMIPINMPTPAKHPTTMPTIAPVDKAELTLDDEQVP